MKKSQQERLNASLDKALAPPKQKPKQNLDALLHEYDDERSGNASAPAPAKPQGIPATIPASIPTGIPHASTAPIIVDNKRKNTAKQSEEPEEVQTYEPSAPLDATHTNAEKIVYSIMYRETISKGAIERHFGPAELMRKTGIRSRNTVHKALYGLIEKLSVEIIAEAQGNPLGPRYRVHKPQTIEQRRKAAGLKIDPQSKRIIERGGIPAGIPATIPAGTPAAIANNWDTTRPKFGIAGIPNFGIDLKEEKDHLAGSVPASGSSSNSKQDDDEAFAELLAKFEQAAKTLTGKEPNAAERAKWGELADLLVAELQIAAARTGSISSVPAFLTEHLRRRLWKKDKAQLERESREAANAPQPQPQVDASKCPDCGGSGWWYPEEPEKGVAKCKHRKLVGQGSD